LPCLNIFGDDYALQLARRIARRWTPPSWHRRAGLKDTGIAFKRVYLDHGNVMRGSRTTKRSCGRCDVVKDPKTG